MSEVKLRNRHLWMAASLADSALGDTAQVYVVYYPQKASLLLAPMDDEHFPTLHKAHLQLFKTRNLQGDKSISLEEILIDHDLDATDRDLSYLHQSGLRMLHISL